MNRPKDLTLNVNAHHMENEAEGSAAISIKVGDNYAAIVGKHNGEFINKAVDFSDPDFATALDGLYQSVAADQRQKLQTYIDNAMASFDNQDADMQVRIDEIITYRNSNQA